MHSDPDGYDYVIDAAIEASTASWQEACQKKFFDTAPKFLKTLKKFQKLVILMVGKPFLDFPHTLSYRYRKYTTLSIVSHPPPVEAGASFLFLSCKQSRADDARVAPRPRTPAAGVCVNKRPRTPSGPPLPRGASSPSPARNAPARTTTSGKKMFTILPIPT